MTLVAPWNEWTHDAQIWMTAEKDSIKVPGFPLIPGEGGISTPGIHNLVILPVSSLVNLYCTWNCISFRGVGLDTDSPIVPQTEQMVHHFKALLALREIDSADIHNTFELGLRVVA